MYRVRSREYDLAGVERLFPKACVGVFVAQKIRVEAYLPQHVADELERVSDNRSEFIREAVKEKLDTEGRVE